MPRSSYHHGDLRNALIAAGLEILCREGIEALSLRRVAREAGVSAAAPYRHFKDKQAILSAIAELGFKRLRSTLEQAAQKKPGDLDAASLAYIVFAQADPNSYRLMFSKNIIHGESRSQSLGDARKDAFATLVETIEIGMQNGKITPTDSSHLALSAWALIHGIALLNIDGALADSRYGTLSLQETLKLCQAHVRAGWATL